MRKLGLGGIVLLYFLTYAPYALVVKLVSTRPDSSLGRPLTGLELLPVTLVVSSLLIILFLLVSGWWRDMPMKRIGAVPVPWPRRGMWVAGVGAAMLLVTVPLSYTFPNVNIPTVQLLMRGDVLVIAPLVDLLSRRRVYWYSWAALALVLAALVINVGGRGAFDFPALLIVIVLVYTIGYFLRLAVMSRLAKSGDDRDLRAYFVEERVVSIPVALGTLGAIAVLTHSDQGRQLAWGFTSAWWSDAMPWLLVISVALFLITIFAALILLSKHENSYCVPLERSASILAGLAVVFILSTLFGFKPAAPTEVISAVLLVAAIFILTLGPNTRRRPRAEPVPDSL
jgi:hypothetical protein